MWEARNARAAELTVCKMPWCFLSVTAPLCVSGLRQVCNNMQIAADRDWSFPYFFYICKTSHTLYLPHKSYPPRRIVKLVYSSSPKTRKCGHEASHEFGKWKRCICHFHKSLTLFRDLFHFHPSLKARETIPTVGINGNLFTRYFSIL